MQKKNTIETQAVMKSFEEFKPTVSISLHEGPQTDGAFFFTNKYVGSEMILPVFKRTYEKQYSPSAQSYFGNKLSVPGQFATKGLFLILMRLWKIIFKFQGFGSYCADRKVPALVMETSWTTAKTSQRVDVQFIALKTLTTHLSSAQFQ
ncbi:hypothetical protein IPL68_01345 [Candidatus Saccharibacteria bacterium]|nr:MAG: hypothetical protein IPL68_01345 [Candidatus Saccharibacteria bacterium]